MRVNRGLRATQIEGFVRGTRANGFLDFFGPKTNGTIRTPKKYDAGHHHFVEGFSLQNEGGQPTLNIIF